MMHGQIHDARSEKHQVMRLYSTPMTKEVRFFETSALGCHNSEYCTKFDQITQIGFPSCLSFMEYLNEWVVEDSRYQGFTSNISRTNPVWVGHILRRNCPVKYITAGKIGEIVWEGGRGRRSKQLMDDVKEKREYWKLEEETLDRTVCVCVCVCVCKTRFGRGYETVV